MGDTGQYQARTHWEQRLRADFSLRGVGHINFTQAYNEWLYRRKAKVIDSLFRDVNLNGKSVLDIGCGTGFFVSWYLQSGARVWGLDITEVSIQNLATRFPGCSFRIQDITDHNYAPVTSFDVVNMWDVIYHIVDDGALGRALDNVANSLAHGGVFLFTDWFGAPQDFQIAPHVKARSLKTYQELLGGRFDLVEVKPLYNALNRKHLGRLDNHLAWLYYSLDMLQNRPSPSNLSVSLWRKRIQSDLSSTLELINGRAH